MRCRREDLGTEKGANFWRKHGRRYGYPECCVEWAALAVLAGTPPAERFYDEAGYPMKDGWVYSSDMEHVPCPNCYASNPGRWIPAWGKAKKEARQAHGG